MQHYDSSVSGEGAEAPSVGSLRVLVVDDDPTARKLLQTQLIMEGMSVFEAEDGLVALDILAREQVDLIITDVLMPRMDGYRLCMEVRQRSGIQHVAIIIHTASYTSPGDEKLSLEIGADRYLRKPASHQLLLETIHDVLREQHPRRGPVDPSAHDFTVMREYNERLVNKLEERNQLLQRREGQFRLLVDHISDALVVQDQEGNIIFANDRFCDFFQCRHNDLVGVRYEDYALPDRQPSLHDARRRCLNGESAQERVECAVLRPDGHQIYFEVNIVPVLQEASIAGTQSLLHDITDRRIAELALHQINEQLERRVGERTAQLEATVKELESFSYALSHDLQAPLRAINSFSRIVLEESADRLGEENKRLLGIVLTNARMMGQLVDELLSFTRLGRQEIEFSSVDMTTLVRTVAEEALHESLPERTIEFDIRPLPQSRGNEVLLRQVWSNLLANAVKFTRRQPKARIRIGSEQRDGANVFSVSDNGIGFDMTYAKKIFDVFHRLHGQEEYEGTGIGLAICKKIIERHGGTIWAEGELNKGATFYFSLPSA